MTDTSVPTVTRIVSEFLARYLDDPCVGFDEPIITGALIDSLVAVQLIDFVQARFSVEVDDDDLDLANFDTVRCIASFVERKTGS